MEKEVCQNEQSWKVQESKVKIKTKKKLKTIKSSAPNGIAIIKPSDMPQGYPSDKPYLVIKITRDRHLIPKKTFSEFDKALKYVERESYNHDLVNLHENPAYETETTDIEAIREFIHGTRDW